MANGHGGFRPGAGQKARAEVERQSVNRGIVLDIAERELPGHPHRTYAEALWLRMFTLAIHGDIMAANLIVPFIAGGKPKQPQEHTGSIDLNLLDWSKPWSPPSLSTPDIIEGEATELPESAFPPKSTLPPNSTLL